MREETLVNIAFRLGYHTVVESSNVISHEVSAIGDVVKLGHQLVRNMLAIYLSRFIRAKRFLRKHSYSQNSGMIDAMRISMSDFRAWMT